MKLRNIAKPRLPGLAAMGAIGAMGAILLLGGCGYVSKYEEAVYDFEPVYCYQSIGSVQCYKTPKAGDERRLVNYFGPAPERYDRPAPAPKPKLAAPKAINYYVLDPEPVPEAQPRKHHLSLPGKKTETANGVVRVSRAASGGENMDEAFGGEE